MVFSFLEAKQNPPKCAGLAEQGRGRNQVLSRFVSNPPSAVVFLSLYIHEYVEYTVWECPDDLNRQLW